MPRGSVSTDDAPVTSEDLYYLVSVVVAQLEDSVVVVNARMSHTVNVLSAVAYSLPMTLQKALEQQSAVETEAVNVSMIWGTLSKRHR
jgi:hypothetical protein